MFNCWPVCTSYRSTPLIFSSISFFFFNASLKLPKELKKLTNEKQLKTQEISGNATSNLRSNHVCLCISYLKSNLLTQKKYIYMCTYVINKTKILIDQLIITNVCMYVANKIVISNTYLIIKI